MGGGRWESQELVGLRGSGEVWIVHCIQGRRGCSQQQRRERKTVMIWG